MLHHNIGVRIISIAIATVILLAGASLLFSGNAKAWDASVNVSPTEVTEGANVNFKIDITNSGSESMAITWVGIHFDWMDEDKYYVSQDVSDSSPYILASGNTASFNIMVPIPNGITTHTTHSVTIAIRAEDPGIIHEWGQPYGKEFTGSVFVQAASASTGNNGGTANNNNGNGDSDNSDAGMIGVAVIGILVIVIIVVLVVVLSKNKGNKPQKPNPQQAPPPPTYNNNERP